MKKLFKVLPLAFAASLTLVSCSEKEANYGDVNTKITIWATAAEEAVIKAVVDEYNAKHKEASEKFTYEYKAVQEGDCGSTLSKDPTVEGAPALALIADDQIYGLQSKDIILELKGSYKEEVLASTTEVAISGASYNDKLFGFPVTSDNGYFLWYNSKALTGEQVGSLESIIATAKAAGKKVLFKLDDGWYVNSVFMGPQVCGQESLKWAEGTDGKVSYTVDWDNEVGAAQAQYLANLIKDNPNVVISGSNEQIQAGFADGSLIAAVSGTWMETSLKELADADENFTLAATKLPTVNGKQLGSFTGSKVYAINKTRPVAEQKVAAALANLLTNKKSQLKRFELRSSLPCNKDAAKDKAYTENVSLGGAALLTQNAYASVQSTSAQDRYWTVGENIGKAILANDIGEFETWGAFLTSQLNILRTAA